MIKIHCFCQTRLHFVEGKVFGEIVVDPTALFDSIIINTSLRYDCPERKSVLKLIARVKSIRVAGDEDEDIILIDGVVEKTSTLHLTMHEAMDIITDYLCIEYFTESDRNHYKNAIEDFVKVRDYVYRCDDCRSLGDTANVAFEVKE